MKNFDKEIENHHISNVEKVQEQVEFFYLHKKKVKIYHGSTNSTRAFEYEKGKYVDVSALNKIISINLQENYISVEPNVPMDILIEFTLQHNLIPPVVMEFPGITVGGAIQGGAGESSSFKYGLFHDCCLEYEMILGNGGLVTVSPSKNPDLFYGTACSYGTLGIITLVKLQLIPAQDFVHLIYETVGSFDEMSEIITTKTKEEIDFVDGIMFSKNSGIVMSGNLSKKLDLPISAFSKASDDWFYLHAEKISKYSKRHEEIIPIKDYLFRYDRGGFWMGKYGFNFVKMPFNSLTRFIFNRFCKTRVLYRYLHSSNFAQRYVIQDISLPQEKVRSFLQYVENKLHMYPLWLCPLMVSKENKFSPSHLKTDLVINVGVWGEAHQDFSRFVKLNRELESYVGILGGRKVLYAHAYYSQEEFWRIYDYDWYKNLRSKYFANTTFPNIYEKIFVSKEYTPSVLGGVLSLIKSPFKIKK